MKMPRVPKRWRWHYETLSRLRERLIADRGEQLREAAEPIERHSMHQADSATDEFDHELALSQLSAEQDALCEVAAQFERNGVIPRARLGALRSVRDKPAAALAESEPTVEDAEHDEPAAPEGGRRIGAVVSRGRRPDLTGDALPRVQAPTLLIVGGYDDVVIRLNEEAFAELRCAKELKIVPGATHLFEEPGALE